MPIWGAGGLWGLAWGPALTVTLDAVRVRNRRLIRVTYDGLAKTGTGETGSVTNLATWTVQRTDTNEFLTVASITLVSEGTWGMLWSGPWGGKRAVDIQLVEPLGPSNVDHTLDGSAVQTADGQAALGSPITFKGLGTTKKTAPQEAQPADLFNAPFSTNPPGGTLVINSDGDYALTDGPDLVRKLIYRRLSTERGAFKHLPDYGIGIRNKLPLPIADLIKTKQLIREQVVQEPEVSDASVDLTLSPEGVLTVTVRAALGDDTVTTGTFSFGGL